jgi:hypothetical protein
MSADRVGYEWHLAVSDTTVAADFTYSRGNGWAGPCAPVNHVGASLCADDAEARVFCGSAEWRITVALGRVQLNDHSTKFYPRYMAQLLTLLKLAIPSLHGYVSCATTGHYWVVVHGVRMHERYPLAKDPFRHAFESLYNEPFPPVHAVARIQYESARLRQVL